MTEPPLVVCRDLACGYPGRTVLKSIDLTLSAGESIALLGVNGSGKSTLLQTIGRLLRPVSGSIAICGENAQGLSFAALAKRISSVPQDEPATFPFLVREIVTMGRISYGTGIFDTSEDRSHALDAMKTAGCAELSERPITQLSGGERQRVWIARAIAQDTPVLLLDEPTSHLDVSHQLSTATLVRALARAGKGVISAVHDLNLASAISDRAILIHGGEVVLEGPVQQVLRSTVLDETYGVRFERVQTASGRLVLTPVTG